VIELNDPSSGSVTVEKWYSGSAYRLSKMTFADGTVWSRSDISDIAAGTKQPFTSASTSGSGRSSRVANENYPTWISMEGLGSINNNSDSGSNSDSTDKNQAFGGTSGGCGTGSAGLVAGIVLLVKAAFRRGKRGKAWR
jgi:hypothetical protein